MTNGVKALSQSGHVEFGADAVGRGDENGVLQSRGTEGEGSAEAPDGAEHTGAIRGGHDVLDALDGLVTGRNVDTGRGVGGTAGWLIE